MNYELIAPRKNCSAIEQVLLNRGLLPKDINHYLQTNDKDILEPTLLDNMEDGAKMLIKHISQDDNVLIIIDSDCDGYVSAAALINYLNCLFPGFVRNHITYRTHTGKQHGLKDMINIIPKDIKLVICPDSSSNDYEEHKLLQEKGVDVLVLDHHEADEISKYACTINNQLCDYPTKSLAGVGVVYKFCCYLDDILGNNYAEIILDLVALGLIADMRDLREFETRHLVTKGLQNIRNPYLKGQIEKQNYQIEKNGGLSPFTVAFYIAPLINATARMGTQEEKLMLFEAMIDYRGYEQIPSTKRGCKGQSETRVEQACRNCTNIKNRQTKARDNSLELIEQLIEEQNLLQNKVLVIRLEPDYKIEKSLTGLIANELASKYQRPVILLNKIVAETIKWEGSCRGYDKSKLTNFKDFVQESNFPYLAEGHQNAFGFGIDDDKIDLFIQYTNKQLADFNFDPSYKVDFIYKQEDLNEEEILDISDWSHLWGQNISEPFVCIENLKISKSDIQLMSRGTLKVTVPNSTVSLIKFGSSEEEYDTLYSELGCVTINVIGTCSRNDWNNTAQIKIVDYEIVNKVNYYF